MTSKVYQDILLKQNFSYSRRFYVHPMQNKKSIDVRHEMNAKIERPEM